MLYNVSTFSQAIDKMRYYIGDSRPLNIEEMKQMLDIFEKMRLPMENLFRGVKRESIPYALQNDFETVKRYFK